MTLERTYESELRDQFATAALNGFTSSMGASRVYDLDLVAKHAYDLADAMLRQRKVPYKTMDQIADEYRQMYKNDVCQTPEKQGLVGVIPKQISGSESGTALSTPPEMRYAKFWLRRDADGSPHVTEDPEEAKFWKNTSVGVTELRPQPTLTPEELQTLARLSDERLRICGISLTARDSDTLRGLLERLGGAT